MPFMCFLLGMMVLVGTMLGIADIIRDLWLDRQPYRDWRNLYLWETNTYEKAPVSKDLDVLDWFFVEDHLAIAGTMPTIAVDDIKIPVYMGYNKASVKRMLEEVSEMSDEGSLEPIYIEVNSFIHDELRNERWAESYKWRSSSQEGYVDML